LTILAALVMAALLQAGTPPRTLDRGDQSNVDEQQQVIVRNAAEWKTLWQKHSPDRPQPRVDFDTEMVVGLFAGSRNSAGYGVEIVSAEEKAGGVVVRYRQREPGSGAITAQILTFPYHLVAIPRRPGAVTFEKIL
jgi:hypothetical protein